MDSVKILREEMSKEAKGAVVAKSIAKRLWSPFGSHKDVFDKTILRSTAANKLTGSPQMIDKDLFYRALIKKDPEVHKTIEKIKDSLLQPSFLEKITKGRLGGGKRLKSLQQLKDEVDLINKGMERADGRNFGNVAYRLALLGGGVGGGTFGISKAIKGGKKRKIKKINALLENQ